MWNRTRFRVMPAILVAFFLVGQGAAAANPTVLDDVDSDADGLADFQELYKYHTDPKKKDTSGTGVLDGDPHERREFSYSVPRGHTRDAAVQRDAS